MDLKKYHINKWNHSVMGISTEYNVYSLACELYKRFAHRINNNQVIMVHRRWHVYCVNFCFCNR